MNIEIYKETDELIHAVAKTICDISKKAIATRGQFNFVLAGGSSPRKLYELLATKEYKNKIEWNKTYFFFGDERFVPENDSQRNSLMAKQTLFEPLKIEESHIFSVDTSGTPKEAAKKYLEDITAHFNNQTIVFDFILLGLGTNVHTASLFPHTSVLNETEATIKSIFLKELNSNRITMTAPLINQSREIAFLVFGKDKTQAVHQVLCETNGSIKQYPARLISPKNGSLHWFLDKNAFNTIQLEKES